MSKKDIKIYHVETQEDYDDLMIELEEQGYKWISGDKPTNKPEYWGDRKENTTVLLNRFQNYRMTRGALDYHKRTYPFTTVIKHKTKRVEQMEKVVVPQFVADWFERNKNGLTIYGLLHLFSDNYFLYDGFRKWVKDYDINGSEAQDIIAKMYLFQNYEVEVEEEKKYYWRKKKEYMFDFEHQSSFNYLNLDRNISKVFFGDSDELILCRTKFTETEIKKLVSEEDFNKLERVEIDDVQ